MDQYGAMRGHRPDAGIDFIVDPIGSKKHREQHTSKPESPSPGNPATSKTGILEGDIDEVCGAITDVRKQSKNKKGEQQLHMQSMTEMRPIECKPEDGYSS